MGLIFLVILIVIIIYFIQYKDSGFTPKDKESPLEILDKRYAKGEISREEYLEAKRTLEER